MKRSERFALWAGAVCESLWRGHPRRRTERKRIDHETRRELRRLHNTSAGTEGSAPWRAELARWKREGGAP